MICYSSEIEITSQGNFSHRLLWVKILVPLGAGAFLLHRPQYVVPGLEESQSSVSMKSGTCSSNHFWFFFFRFVRGAESCWNTTHLSPQIRSKSSGFILFTANQYLKNIEKIKPRDIGTNYLYVQNFIYGLVQVLKFYLKLRRSFNSEQIFLTWPLTKLREIY